MNRIEFYYFHPLSLFVYFVFVLISTMLTFNPVMILISLFGAVSFDVFISRFRKKSKNYIFYVLIIITATLTNPLFSHNGMTVLFYLGDNAVTLESFCYGMNMALMIISVVVWCRNYSKCVTQDKFLYLFSKPMPKISLILSGAIRFIPLFVQKYKCISVAQRGLGTERGKKGIERIKFHLAVFSALVTWSLEKSVETSDSMKSRGYDLKNKTQFSPFKFCKKDLYLFIVSALSFTITLIAIINKNVEFSFYPTFVFTKDTFFSTVGHTAFAVLSFIPFVIEVKENLLWKYFVSKI